MSAKPTPPPVVPEVGQAVVFRFDGNDTVVWWGTGPEGRDLLAARDGRIMTWPTVEEAVSHAGDAGWEIDWDAGISTDQTTLVDFSPAQRRLAGSAEPVDPQSAVDLWNFATDVAHTLGLTFHDSGTLPDLCHEKLTKATVPFAFGLTEYQLRWTPAELRVVRRVLADAVHVVRMGIGTAKGTVRAPLPEEQGEAPAYADA